MINLEFMNFQMEEFSFGLGNAKCLVGDSVGKIYCFDLLNHYKLDHSI